MDYSFIMDMKRTRSVNLNLKNSLSVISKWNISRRVLSLLLTMMNSASAVLMSAVRSSVFIHVQPLRLGAQLGAPRLSFVSLDQSIFDI